MKNEIKEEWKKNLTSGKFKQGKGYLREWNFATEEWEYCCLGVLCEQSNLGEWVEEERTSFSRGIMRRVSRYLGATQYLPRQVAEWAGIDYAHDDNSTAQGVLAGKNDEGYPFTDIAEDLDWVLERFEGK